MTYDRQKAAKIRIIVILSLLILGQVLAAYTIRYIRDYYRADEAVAAYFSIPEAEGTVQVTKTNDMVFLDGEGTEYAVVFYPGAKVEFTAYVPLFYQLAEQGVDCFLLKMPGNLAILDADAAAEVMEAYTYEHWYIAGHSLGGSFASDFAAKNSDKLEGLILLAAYPMRDLTESGLKFLSVIGENDLVINRDNLMESRELEPKDHTMVWLVGGNHAGFGNYGEQDGDGVATMSRELQQQETVALIMEMIKDE